MKIILQCKIFWQRCLGSLFIFLLTSLINPVSANPAYHLSDASYSSNPIVQIKDHWAIAVYETPEEKRIARLAGVVAEAEDAYVRDRHNADAALWYGISLATYAEARGGLSAPIYNKAARTQLQKAIELNVRAKQGLAHAMLGILYQDSDQERAHQYLQQALNLDPDGLDTNYYYGSFLARKGNTQKAQKYFNKALEAQPRMGFERADQGRLDQIRKMVGRST